MKLIVRAHSIVQDARGQNLSHLPRNDGLWPITRPVLPSKRMNQPVENTRNKTMKISITVSGSGGGRGSGRREVGGWRSG